MQLERERLLGRVVDLVREHEHRLVRLAEDLRDLLVARRDPDARVDDEEHEIGLRHGLARLFARSRGVIGVGSAMSTPPVSTSTKRLPVHSQTSSLRSRVTPGISCTTAARVSVRRLTSVDLPTFGKPTIATAPQERRRRRRFEQLGRLGHADA